MTPINRREWLQLMVASGITLVADKAIGQRPAPFRQLEAKWITTTLNGNRAMLRSYNGQVPGPLLTAKPGETLNIRVKNSLFAPRNAPARGAIPPGVSTKWNGDHNVPHHFEVTNLHTHGFDTIPHLFAPLGNSDPASSMIAIKPGESFDYASRSRKIIRPASIGITRTITARPRCKPSPAWPEA